MNDILEQIGQTWMKIFLSFFCLRSDLKHITESANLQFPGSKFQSWGTLTAKAESSFVLKQGVEQS